MSPLLCLPVFGALGHVESETLTHFSIGRSFRFVPTYRDASGPDPAPDPRNCEDERERQATVPNNEVEQRSMHMEK
jgi:hypothetical protein